MAANNISTLATKEERQIAKLELAQAKRQQVGTPGYRDLRYYDIDLLPSKYSGNDVVHNSHPEGLVQGRPWKTTPNILAGLWRSTYAGYFGGNSTWFDSQTATESVQVDNFNLYDGDVFSSQWVGYFRAPHTANYTFYLHSDDASKFWIGNNAITGYTDANTTVKIDAYSDPEADSDAISLTAGQYYPIRLQYGNNGGFASLNLSWSDDAFDILFELDASTYTSGTSWADSSTHGRNATLHGGITWNSEAGGCFVFPGDDTKFIDIAGSESGFGIRDLAPNATFSIWVNLDSQGGFFQQVGGWRGNDFNFYFVVLEGGTEARVDSGTQNDIGVSYGSYFNNWTLVTFATNSTTSSLYLNGTLVGTNTNISGTQWSGDAIFELGHSRDYQFPITGKIGGAIAYNRELTQLEVTAEFNRTKTRYGL
jgi:hypothetical protein